MKNQSKKYFATFFALWAMFIVPILAQPVANSDGEIVAKAETAAVIDSLQTQEPPGMLELPPGEIWTASYYGGRFHGRHTASGEIYNQFALTCAHKTLPFQTILQVTNPNNGKSVIVRVNDRGPFSHGRDLDLSYAAAEEIGMLAAGVMKVEVVQIPEIAQIPEAKLNQN